MIIGNRHIRTLLGIGGVMILFSAWPVWAEAVAEVNGEEISETEFMQTLKSRFGYTVLQTMIEALAIRQEAAARGIIVSPEEIDARYQEAKQEIIWEARLPRPPEEVFAIWLAQRHLNPETFRERVALQVMLERMVADKVAVTDDEVRQYYESHQEELALPEAMKLSHVCVTTEEQAERIRQEILEDKIAFEEAANKYSIDPYGRENGGLIGFVVRGEDPVQQAAFELDTDGELSPVVQSQKGFHILRREAYQEAGTPPFEEIRDQLKQRIHQGKLLQAAGEMRQGIIKTAQIEQFIEFPPTSESPSSE